MKKLQIVKFTNLIICIIIIFIIGIFFVPVNSVWGEEKNVINACFVPIWMLVSKNYNVNGYVVFYEINIFRTIYNLLIPIILSLLIDNLIEKLKFIVQKK